MTPERRGSARASTVLLIGRVRDDRRDCACRILNLSDAGLMVRLDFPASVGQRVLVELRGLAPAAAIVRWVSGLRAGMQFELRQDVRQVFCLTGDDGRVARAPRFDVSIDGVLRFADRRIAGHIVNISPGGMRIAADVPVEPGEMAQIVAYSRGLCRFGSVRWAAGGEFGMHFSSPLALTDLAGCLAKR